MNPISGIVVPGGAWPMTHTAADGQGVRIGFSSAADPGAAATELRALLDQPRMGLVVVFPSNRYDLDVLGGCLCREFGSVPVIGCTTAGEIGPLGYTENGLAGFSLGQADFTVETCLIEAVSKLESRGAQTLAFDLRRRLVNRVMNFESERSFALMLVDGLCMREENLARAFHDGLGGIPLVGGSAGDGLSFGRTAVLHGGRFQSDAALLLVVSTPSPVATFKTQHFICGPRRLVVTSADPERRIVSEINGLPAAEEYSRAAGVAPESLDPLVCSAHPLVVRVGGTDFVRSVQRINPDGSMMFYCAIDEGIVFNVAEGVDMVANLEAVFEDVVGRIGPPSLVIGCDCILRRLEMSAKGIVEDISAVMRAHNVVGFSTYGEQFRGMHVNQTFTGIAIGARAVP